MSDQDHKLSRRDFLKVAGAAGAVVGVGGGLTGLAACGSSSTPAASGSSSGAAAGRTIKVGMVSPVTGALAAFGEADGYCVTRWKEAVKDGITTADGVVHPVEIIVKDSQSDSNRAATVAGDLITSDGVDIMMVTSTSDTVVPVADQAEALGVPCVSSDSPWQPFYFGRGATRRSLSSGRTTRSGASRPTRHSSSTLEEAPEQQGHRRHVAQRRGWPGLV